jgi:glycosyltransferase involved in cell wall biosynthesis
VRQVKGFDVLLRAAAKVCARNPGAAFVVVGGVAEADHLAELQSLSKQLELTERFVFAGESKEVSKYLQAGDIFVLPSRNEGFSNALIEGMAARLPCIATAVGGNAEAVEDGRSGFIVPPEDLDALAERIEMLIRDPELARRMGEAGRKRVEEKFTLSAMMERLCAEYAHLNS